MDKIGTYVLYHVKSEHKLLIFKKNEQGSACENRQKCSLQWLTL